MNNGQKYDDFDPNIGLASDMGNNYTRQHQLPHDVTRKRLGRISFLVHRISFQNTL